MTLTRVASILLDVALATSQHPRNPNKGDTHAIQITDRRHRPGDRAGSVARTARYARERHARFSGPLRCVGGFWGDAHRADWTSSLFSERRDWRPGRSLLLQAAPPDA